MNLKQLLIPAIACSGLLFAGMGVAVAANNTTTGNTQADSSATNTPVMPPAPATHDQAQSTSGATSATTTVQESGLADNAAGTTANPGPTGTDNDTTQQGRMVGALVDDTGRLQGYVIRSVNPGVSSATKYVVVRLPRNWDDSNASSSATSMAQSNDSSEHSKNADGDQQQLLKHMYRLLQKQALQIHMLKAHIMQEQNADQMSNGMGGGYNQQASAEMGPLGQVAHVIVDKHGRVQAVVLDSGVVLMSDKWANAMQRQDNGVFQSTSQNTGTSQGASNSRQHPRAIVVLKPQP